MIRPGLLTASTNKADHVGRWFGMVLHWFGAPFAARGFGLVNAGFPLRSDVRTRVGARTYGQSSTSAFDGSLVAALREVSDVGESARFVVESYSKQVFPFRNEGEARQGAHSLWEVRNVAAR